MNGQQLIILFFVLCGLGAAIYGVVTAFQPKQHYQDYQVEGFGLTPSGQAIVGFGGYFAIMGGLGILWFMFTEAGSKAPEVTKNAFAACGGLGIITIAIGLATSMN